MKVRDRILVITDLMLGALYADATMTGEEEGAVRELLAKLLLTTADALPEQVDQRIRGFTLASFDIERAANEFLRDPPMKKRRLLELLATLTDRDGTDLGEDDYLRDLAQCLGMQPDECRGVVLDYEIEQLREGFDAIRVDDHGGPRPDRASADVAPRWRRGASRARLQSERAGPPPIPPARGPRGERAERVAIARHATGEGPRKSPPPIPEAARRR